jgi:hypothetical protein
MPSSSPLPTLRCRGSAWRLVARRRSCYTTDEDNSRRSCGFNRVRRGARVVAAHEFEHGRVILPIDAADAKSSLNGSGESPCARLRRNDCTPTVLAARLLSERASHEPAHHRAGGRSDRTIARTGTGVVRASREGGRACQWRCGCFVAGALQCPFSRGGKARLVSPAACAWGDAQHWRRCSRSTWPAVKVAAAGRD